MARTSKKHKTASKPKTRIGIGTRRILVMKVVELGVPDPKRVARAFVEIFRPEIEKWRYRFHNKKAEAKARKNRRRKRST